MHDQSAYEQLEQRCHELEQQFEQEYQQSQGKDRIIEQLRAENQRLRKLIEIKDSITFNKGMSYAERNGLQGIVANHPDQVLKGEKFEIDVWQERKAVGIGSDCASKLFSALGELGAIDYSVTTSKVDGKPQSKSAIAIDLNAIATVNTKDATKRVQQREAVSKRRLEAVNHPVCPECIAEGGSGSDYIKSVVSPVCMKHERVFEEYRQLKDPKKLFSLVEDELPTSDEKPSTTNTERTESPTTSINEPDYIRDGYGDECPIEPDYIRDSLDSSEPEPVLATSASSLQQSLFPEKQRVTPVTLTPHGHPLPSRACFKCGVQDWQWNDVLEIPVCGNCG